MSKARDKANSTVSNFASTGIDDNADANAITIDSSENVLIDKTSSNYQTVGHELRNGGRAFHTADGSKTLSLNRLSSDGGILDFYKDNSEVGSVSVSDANNLSIDCTTTDHAGLTFATENILPRKNSANTDNAVDLGAGSARFKDLYLRGSVYADIVRHHDDTDTFMQWPGGNTLAFNTGGSERLRIQSGGGISFNGDTAAANALSDYEEGTWTVTVGSGITNPSYNSQTGSYVKIGSLVIASFNMDTASGGTRNGDQMRFDGLPYAKKGSDPSEGGYITYEASFYSPGSMPYLGNSSSGFVFHKPDGNALNGTALSSANFICRGTIIYRAS